MASWLALVNMAVQFGHLGYPQSVQEEQEQGGHGRGSYPTPAMCRPPENHPHAVGTVLPGQVGRSVMPPESTTVAQQPGEHARGSNQMRAMHTHQSHAQAVGTALVRQAGPSVVPPASTTAGQQSGVRAHGPHETAVTQSSQSYPHAVSTALRGQVGPPVLPAFPSNESRALPSVNTLGQSYYQPQYQSDRRTINSALLADGPTIAAIEPLKEWAAFQQGQKLIKP